MESSESELPKTEIPKIETQSQVDVEENQALIVSSEESSSATPTTTTVLLSPSISNTTIYKTPSEMKSPWRKCLSQRKKITPILVLLTLFIIYINYSYSPDFQESTKTSHHTKFKKLHQLTVRRNEIQSRIIISPTQTVDNVEINAIFKQLGIDFNFQNKSKGGAGTGTGTGPGPDNGTGPDNGNGNGNGQIQTPKKSKCNIPMLNPYDPKIVNLLHSPNSNPKSKSPIQKACLLNPNTINSKPSSRLFTTDLESSLIQQNDPKKFGYFHCCYRAFVFKSRNQNQNDDQELQIKTKINATTTKTKTSTALLKSSKKCYPIVAKITKIPAKIEFIQIECSKSRQIKDENENDKKKISTVNVNANANASEMRNDNDSAIIVDMFGFVRLNSKSKIQSPAQKIVKENNGLAARVGEKLMKYSKLKMGSVSNSKTKFNIVVLGFDGVSHMNWIRRMPTSYNYIMKNLSAIGFSGFTKIGLNGFPNIVATLTGLLPKELQAKCWNKEDNYTFDNCPFIWKNFSNLGYKTAYADDDANRNNYENEIGAIRMLHNGFKSPPTDSYYNTLTYRHAKPKQLQNQPDPEPAAAGGVGGEIKNSNLNFPPKTIAPNCTTDPTTIGPGRFPSFKILLNYLKKMAFAINPDSIQIQNEAAELNRRKSRTRPKSKKQGREFKARYFQIVWSTSLFRREVESSGPDALALTFADRALMETLDWFKKSGNLNRSIFILMSSHGQFRSEGKFPETFQGKVEARLPLLYFIIPKLFQKQYRAAFQNLKTNQHRLTTPLDLHATLKDLLNLNNLRATALKNRRRYIDNFDNFVKNHENNDEDVNLKNGKTSARRPRALSLFLPIPSTRTCEDAGINIQWCVCTSMSPLAVDLKLKLNSNSEQSNKKSSLSGTGMTLEGENVKDLNSDSDLSLDVLSTTLLTNQASESVLSFLNRKLANISECPQLSLDSDSVTSAFIFDTENGNGASDGGKNSNLGEIQKTRENLRKINLGKSREITINLNIQVKPLNVTFEVSTTRRSNGTWNVWDDVSVTRFSTPRDETLPILEGNSNSSRNQLEIQTNCASIITTPAYYY